MQFGGRTMKSILIVDDIDANRLILKEILKEEYEVLEAGNGEKAIDILLNADDLPDAVLLDVSLPGIDGLEVLNKIKEYPEIENIPVLFITDEGSDLDEIRGMEEGAVDCITRPFDPSTVILRIDNHIRFMREKERLEVKLERKTSELQKTHEHTLETLAEMIECRSFESGTHIRSMMKLMRLMVNHLFTNPKYRDEMTAEFCRYTVKAVALHDIGKIGIPDEILLKPGKLSPDEFEIIKQHSVIGSNIIDRIAGDDFDGAEYLKYAREICRSHHERWDGKGYPDNLMHEEIPLSARIAAIIDVYDALVSVRCYKTAHTHEDALRIMKEGNGTQFDPYLLNEFMVIADSAASIIMEQ